MKLYRAKKHYMELCDELSHFYEQPETVRPFLSLDGDIVYITAAIPTRLALIAGDFLQCLRSSLDYLIWELALANGCQPNGQNSFPICSTLKDYQNEVVNRHRLDGLSKEAQAMMNALQPFHSDDPMRSPLIVLEKLTNINKHRRVLLTAMRRLPGSNPPVSFPHIFSTIHVNKINGFRKQADSSRFFVVINEDSEGVGIEIRTLLESLSNFVGYKILPGFKKFFEVA